MSQNNQQAISYSRTRGHARRGSLAGSLRSFRSPESRPRTEASGAAPPLALPLPAQIARSGRRAGAAPDGSSHLPGPRSHPLGPPRRHPRPPPQASRREEPSLAHRRTERASPRLAPPPPSPRARARRRPSARRGRRRPSPRGRAPRLGEASDGSERGEQGGAPRQGSSAMQHRSAEEEEPVGAREGGVACRRAPKRVGEGPGCRVARRRGGRESRS